METKICKRCGIERPIDQFRPYYGRPSGRYSFCKTCERIEQRRKYLVGKDAADQLDGLSAEEQAELSKINELYAYHQAAGRPVPGKGAPRCGVLADVESLMSK